MSIYQNLFDLIQTYIYGGAPLTADMSLVCTLIATMGCLFVIALPFAVVLWFVRTICFGWNT